MMPAASSGRSLFIRKKDCAKVHRTMESMHHFDQFSIMHHFDQFSINAIENQIVAVNYATDVGVLVARDQRKPPWRERKRLAFPPKFANKSNGSRWIVLGDGIANPLQVSLSVRCNDYDHEPLASAMARYLASSRSKTSAAGLTRPASASAMPRAIAASRPASCASRSLIRRTPSRNTSLFDL